jgi:two-component system, LytTR family, sensor histidine kinase AlgZ
MGILSAFERRGGEVSKTRPDKAHSGSVLFDNCQLGMVLRAVLMCELALAIALMFNATSLMVWIENTALITCVALPATLAWLMVGCACKTWLLNKPVQLQAAFGIGLGAACGAGTYALLPWLPTNLTTPVIAPVMAGAAMAGLLILQAALRRRATIPENTNAQLRELQARIQPHFLFNTLNTAIALVKKDPEQVESILQDLSDLFRSALSKSRTSMPLEEEITLVRQYLAIERCRFGDRLQVHWQIDPSSLPTQIVPLMLQPLVENAVKHGIETSMATGHIWIRTKVNANFVEIKIINTLPSKTDEAVGKRPGFGIGLKSVTDRLDLFYDMAASLDAQVIDDTYVVQVQIPRKTALALTDNHGAFV